MTAKISVYVAIACCIITWSTSFAEAQESDEVEPQYVPELVPKEVHIVKPKLPAKKKITGHSANVKYANFYTGNFCKEPNPFVPLGNEPYYNRTSKETLTVYFRCLGGFMAPVVCGYKKKPVTDLCVLYDKKCWQVMLETPMDIEGMLSRRKKLEKCLGRVFIG